MINVMKSFKEFLNESVKGKEVKALFDNEEDWGDFGSKVFVEKKNLVIVDTYWAGSDKALQNLKNNWSPNGPYFKYLKEKGISVKIVDEFIQTNAEGKYKKLTKDGIVGIEIEVN